MATNFNITNFKTQLKNGGARPNQFQIRITFPELLVTNAPQLMQAGAFLITVAELPGQVIGTTPVYYRGRELKLAGDKQFAPFQCTILNDTDFTLRSALEKWMNGIEDMQQKRGAQRPVDYQKPIEIDQLDRNGNVLRSYKLVDAFPTELSPINLDFSANDQLSNFSVQFQYQHFDFYGPGGRREDFPSSLIA